MSEQKSQREQDYDAGYEDAYEWIPPRPEARTGERLEDYRLGYHDGEMERPWPEK